MFYGQLDTLHMFDSKPGDSVRWTLAKENGHYKIIFLSSCRADVTIPSHKVRFKIAPFFFRKVYFHACFKIFPFIAAETKQIEMSNMAKGKSNFNEIAKMKLNHSPISQYKRVSVEVKNEDLERNLSDVSVRLTPLEISTDEEIALHCRRNSVSIMGVLSPRRSESETGTHLHKKKAKINCIFFKKHVGKNCLFASIMKPVIFCFMTPKIFFLTLFKSSYLSLALKCRGFYILLGSCAFYIYRKSFRH